MVSINIPDFTVYISRLKDKVFKDVHLGMVFSSSYTSHGARASNVSVLIAGKTWG